jgi:hypothetical protein
MRGLYRKCSEVVARRRLMTPSFNEDELKEKAEKAGHAAAQKYRAGWV